MAKKKCTAKSRKGKCLQYTKKHTNKKAMEAHRKALKKRGAKVTTTTTANGWQLKYNF